ncbi:MAG: cyclic nucleotide-binding domain-containing protein [Ilumatobacteraceae bacterium]
MRVEGSTSTISWIPSEAVSGPMKGGFTLGVSHYDSAPPDALGADVIAKLDELNAADRFRFANHLHAWVEFSDDGEVVEAAQDGCGHIGVTNLRLGGDIAVAAVAMPDLRPAIEVGPGWARFTQTAGGRTGAPMPRAVRRAPFVQFRSPVAWTTLELTLHADGRREGKLRGASPFPRHWLYDSDGALSAKSGMTDWKEWASKAFGKGTPWGDEDSPAFVTEVESALERELSGLLMRGAAKPKIRSFKEGQEVTRKGDQSTQLFLLLDGVLVVDVDGKELAEIGPGAVLGERAILEGGVRTATLTARTNCKIAVVPADQLDRKRLAELAAGHRREGGGEEVDLLATAADAARPS